MIMLQSTKEQLRIPVVLGIVVIAVVIAYIIIRIPAKNSQNPEPLISQSAEPTTSTTLEWKTFKHDDFSLAYPTKICDTVNVPPTCLESKLFWDESFVAIGQVKGNYVSPIKEIYYNEYVGTQAEAEKYLLAKGFTRVQSWSSTKAKNGDEIKVAHFDNTISAYAAYSHGTVVAFWDHNQPNSTGRACLIDCGTVDSTIYHGIKLDGVSIYDQY